MRGRSPLFATLLALAIAAPAMAQPTPDVAQETPEKRRARALLKEGVRLHKLGQYTDALELFRDAYQAFPSPSIFLNIALAETGLNRRADAANTYQRYLDAPDRDPAKVAAVEADLATLDGQVGRVHVTLDISESAELRLDGQAWFSPSPSRLVRVDPGSHRIGARAVAHIAADVPFDVAVGAVAEVSLQILPAPAVPAVTEPSDSAVAATTTTATTDVPTAITARVTPRRPGRVGGQLQVLVEGRGQGAAGALGATFAATPRLKLAAGGIVGPNVGGYATATFALTAGTVRPTLTGGVPVMVADGVHVGVRGAAGLEWAMSRRASLIADVAAEYYPSPGTFYEAFMLVPSLGVHARL